jgi:DNA repair protein RadC
MLRALRDEALTGAEISGTEALARYLRADMGYRPCEQLRILFLATGNRLLADEVVIEGSIDSASVLPRPIVHRALELGATGIIAVHNHPGGSPEPSRADIEATRYLVTACRPLEIEVHDHLIVARGGWTSLRLKGLL